MYIYLYIHFTIDRRKQSKKRKERRDQKREPREAKQTKNNNQLNQSKERTHTDVLTYSKMNDLI